ncbi:MAG: TonB-dependent receptor [Caulobacteraceae bacterium]|nr:TonB-dependent receptor [Caulobacteraceae bacterium]
MTIRHNAPIRAARLHVLIPILAGSLFAYSAAFAQSTGSQAVEDIVVTAKKQISLAGVVTLQEAPKTRSVITGDYIMTQPPGQTVLQDLNLAPGVNFTSEDPFGMTGSNGHLRIRGFDGARISLLVDGVPLNDTGNYAIYGGELVDPEVIAQTNVNVGSTDVDSPTASATGGLININTLKPTTDFNGFLVASGGSDDYRRIAGLINSGEIGPYGTRLWVEGSYQKYKKFKGYGDFEKKQVNFKVYQPLMRDGDFVAVAGFYDDQYIPNTYGLNYAVTGTKSPAAADPWGTDYLPNYNSAGKTPGTAGNDGSGTCVGLTPTTANCQGGNYYGNQINPTKTGNLRGESRFTLLNNLHLTVDPSMQYVIADGGGQARTISESDIRLKGTASTFPTCPTGQSGVDLNGDGDCLDTVRVFLPSITQTLRTTVNTSLIWDINPSNLIRFSYAYDHGNHRQSGEATLLDAGGTPLNPYGGKDGYGPKILAADGTPLRYRDRLSIAELNQYSLEYIGRFFDERLRIDLGVRDPHFSRQLNQYCYTSTKDGSAVQCSSTAPGGLYTIAPFKLTVKYTKVLPNVGLSWKFDQANMVYTSYTEQLSAPKTDDLYTVKSDAGTVNIDSVKPESTRNYELGYRYQTPRLIASIALWDTEFENRIIQSYDPATNLSQDRNVGSVKLYGVDAQIGATPIDHLNLLANVSYAHSRLKDNIPFGLDKSVTPNTTIIEYLKGKQQVETPDWMVSGRAAYDFSVFTVGITGKYVGKRWVTDMNDLSTPSYYTFDFDGRVKLDRFLKGSYLQVNVINLFDKKYLGSLGTKATNNSDSQYYSGSAPYAYQGAPRTFWVSVHAAF